MDKILSPENTSLALQFGLKVLIAAAVLIVGFAVSRMIVNALGKLMQKKEVDETLQPFLRSALGAILKTLVILSVLSMVGIEVTSFIAILGAAGLAVGMALSGTLQNFAGGVLILLLKPFKRGDVIEAQGYTGSVDEIQIFSTLLKTFDNRRVIIPNGPLSTGAVVNYSSEKTRRVDWTFGIGYGDDVDTAKKLLFRLIKSDERILPDPPVFIAVSELADSSVNLVARVWVRSEDYWGVYFDMVERVYNTFNQEGLNIPYPQMDVHVHQSN